MAPSADTHQPAAPNLGPTISGDPPTTATVGSLWTFDPLSSDPEGDALLFEAEAIPGWLDIDPSTGRLSGVPAEADVGTWSGIVLSVSDGVNTSSLPAFDLSVVASGAAAGWARLSWSAPEQREDGSPVGELTGYSIYYGIAPRQYDRVIRVPNPGVTSYLIEGLGEGTWYFAMTAQTGDGLESGLSAEVSKTISPCDAGDPLASC